MADEDEKIEQDGETEQHEGVESAPKKKILLLLLPIFLVIGSVIGIYFSGIADSFLSVKKGDKKAEASDTVQGDKPTGPLSIFFDVPELLVNLSSRAGQKPVYFKIKIALEMENQEGAAQAEKLLPRIVDSLQFYLREMRLEELQGSAGTYRLKEEIQGRLNRVLAPAKVNDVLFKEVLIQ